MLYPFRLISEEVLPVGRDQSGAPPLAWLLTLLRNLSGLFDTAPAVLALPGSAVLTFLYRDVAYPWRDVMAAAGPAAAGLADSLPLRFFGTTQARETAELTARREGEAVLVRLRSVSGRPIQMLEGLGLQARLPDAETAAQIAEIAASGPFLAPCGVVKRHCEALLAACGLLAPTGGSLFSYLAWETVEAPACLSALTAGHKAALWRTFLEDGQQPMEFDWLWESYYSGEAVFLLEWELALRMVLEDLGFQVERGDVCFRVTDPLGRERRFDFAWGGPAEKLFLKLLFPLDTKEGAG